SPSFLRASLAAAVDISFNMVTVDGDTSPDDMVVVLANGAAGIPEIDEGSPAGPAFRAALDTICVDLARGIVRDAEGATRLITVVVEGAPSTTDARLMARTVASSPLVKTAVHGGDPNWGRVLAAAGRSGAEMVPERIDLDIAGHRLFERGTPRPYDATSVSSAMAAAEIEIRLDLHLGGERAIAWGCDLSEEYVRFNADYTT
ncbi:MAG: bifunctional ornithine acetyltransferase/N-acetylglutamate synthase, partial [Chloroflexi bacterium]|nr:bifunctional ornithine acetyltransferase/N-acetylglutamate synthase [Chloroflexota bacterium]